MNEHIETPQEEHVVYEFFFWSVLAKGAISVVEVISGLAAFFIPPDRIVSIAVFFLNLLPLSSVQGVLLGEVMKYTEGTVAFVALYLLSRGLIKVALIAALLRNWLWAYPASLVVLSLFVLYQAYQIVADRSLIVLFITVFDLVVMYFIFREWKIARRHAVSRVAPEA